MKITEISYRELINTGNYENITIEMKATISDGDDVEMCTEKLVRKVKRELKKHHKEDY